LSAERFGRTIRAPSTQEPNDDHAVSQPPCPLRQKLIDDMNMRHFSLGWQRVRKAVMYIE
jgi:hypothetical protein